MRWMLVKLFCVRSRKSSTDVFPLPSRIEFGHHSQVFAKVESCTFVVCSPSLLPCSVVNLCLQCTLWGAEEGVEGYV